MSIVLIGWLALWAASCARLAGGPLPPGDRPRFGELFWPSFAIGLLAVVFCVPSNAFLEGTVAVMLTSGAKVDARTGFLFDALTAPCAALCIAGVVVTGVAPASIPTMIALVGPLAALALLSHGTWLGWGDVKACFSLAVAFGPFDAPLALLLAAFSGIQLILTRREIRAIPFGPHLARGAALTLALNPITRHLEAFAR